MHRELLILFLTCCRRIVHQLYCPKYWEFTKHVKCSGDFLCTITDLYFVVFVLYYMVIPLSDCKLMPLELFPRVSTVRVSAAQGPMAIKKKGARSRNRSRFSPCLG